MENCLITGVAGFIGSRALEFINSHGINGVGMDRVDVQIRTHNCGPQRYIKADISRDDALEIPSGIDTILHLAGKAHALAEVAQDIDEYHRINTEGTKRLLIAAQKAGVKSFVLFSTVKAMEGGNAMANHPLVAGDETRFAVPDTPYGQSKLAAEKLVLDGGYVPHPVVIRPCLVYGPTPKGNLAKMISAVSRGIFPPIPEVNNRRSMVHIDDVLEAAFLAADHPAAKGRVYIAADNEPFSTRQLYDWISEACGRRAPKWSVPLSVLRMLAQGGDAIGKIRGRRFMFDSDALEKLTGSAWYSSAKLQRELGWKPTHTLRETIPEIVRMQISK